MDITGTSGDDVLTGTADPDVINGLGGNDTIDGGGGNDIINGGTGNDQLSGGDGDDTFIEDQFAGQTDTFNGGAGFDTIELRAVPTPIVTNLGVISPHTLSGASTLTSIERLVFASNAGQTVQASVSYSLLGSTGLTQLVGGAGRDFLSFSIGTAGGTFTMPVLTLTNWDSAPTNAWTGGTDFVVMGSGAPVGTSVTLNAAAGLNTLQILSGGFGDDVLNGSGNADYLDGRGGANQLNGNGGNDSLAIVNNANPGPGGFLPPTTYSGAGSTLDGGTGTDVLTIGGYVILAATLVSIEGVNLLPAFIPPVPNTARQDAAVLELDSTHLAMLPATAFFRGTGSVVVYLDDGASFAGGQYVIQPGSAVQFEVFAGAGNGVSMVGTSGDDIIHFGAGTQTATGGAGADRFTPGLVSGVVTDFTLGVDKIDFTGTDITNLGRFGDLNLVQSGANVVLSADTGGQHFEMVLQNINLANLTVNNIILSDASYQAFDTGTTFDDLLFGFGLNDELHGSDGNDRIYGGGGVDRLYGDAGNDLIILDGATAAGGIYDGGAGTDSLLLRNYDGAAASPFGPASIHNMLNFTQQAVTSVERIVFESQLGTSIQGIMQLAQLGASGVTEIVGGAGVDFMVFIVNTGGTYTMPNLTLTNWATGGAAGTDGLVLVAASNVAGITLNALEGLAANQVLFGGNLADVLNGSSAADLLNGNAGNDVINGGGGLDLIYGGLGDDQYIVTTQAALLFENAGEGTDSVSSSISYYLFANIENLTLTGSAGNFGVGNDLANVLTGNAGENLLIAGAGNDEVRGGAARDAIFGQDGADSLYGDGGIDYIVAGTGNDIIDGGADADEIYGQEGDDTIIGGASFDTDIIVGGDGNDTIFGNSGAGDFDYLYGNLGNDTFYVDTPADLVFEQAGEGTDTVYAGINGGGYYLYDNIENLILTDSTPFGVGNALDNGLTGNAISNYLLGGAGNDTLNGMGGNDVLFGEGGNDTFVFTSGTGGDVIGDFTAGQDRIDLSAFGFSFAQAQANFIQNGNVGALNLGNGDFIVLHNVTMSTLTATDFIFG